MQKLLEPKPFTQQRWDFQKRSATCNTRFSHKNDILWFTSLSAQTFLRKALLVATTKHDSGHQTHLTQNSYSTETKIDQCKSMWEISLAQICKIGVSYALISHEKTIIDNVEEPLILTLILTLIPPPMDILLFGEYFGFLSTAKTVKILHQVILR